MPIFSCDWQKIGRNAFFGSSGMSLFKFPWIRYDHRKIFLRTSISCDAPLRLDNRAGGYCSTALLRTPSPLSILYLSFNIGLFASAWICIRNGIRSPRRFLPHLRRHPPVLTLPILLLPIMLLRRLADDDLVVLHPFCERPLVEHSGFSWHGSVDFSNCPDLCPDFPHSPCQQPSSPRQFIDHHEFASVPRLGDPYGGLRGSFLYS